VNVGDTLGFVGNTGNARTTPPHLHFGIYRRGQGPVDPYPFVYRSTATASRVTADTSELGALARSRARMPLVAAPEASAANLTTIAAATPLRIDGAAANWYRVRLPDGTTGYVDSRRDHCHGDRWIAARRGRVCGLRAGGNRGRAHGLGVVRPAEMMAPRGTR